MMMVVRRDGDRAAVVSKCVGVDVCEGQVPIDGEERRVLINEPNDEDETENTRMTKDVDGCCTLNSARQRER